MANPPVNPKQFGEGHQEAISRIEGAHGVGFTRAGLQYGDGRKFAPIANISAGSGGISFVLPTEDPNVANTMFLTTTSSGHPQGKVVTDEYHTYPDSDKTAWRYNDHADVPSAMEHLAQGARERAGHLEKGTSPSTEESGVNGMNGKWVNYRTPFHAREKGPQTQTLSNNNINMRQPPNIINYYSGHPDDDNETSYEVDTGTRERIPDKDQ